MKAHNLKSPLGTTHRARRVGRGHSAGQGKTSGRGTKGQGARSGGVKPPYFEGGQLPFVRRLPFIRGFVNIHKISAAPVNVQSLNTAFSDGDDVTPEKMEAAGLIKSAGARVKVLGAGELQKKLSVHAHSFSESAKDKIEKAGGQTVVL
jgi:large subunit ribosomal protein L15